MIQDLCRAEPTSRGGGVSMQSQWITASSGNTRRQFGLVAAVVLCWQFRIINYDRCAVSQALRRLREEQDPQI